MAQVPAFVDDFNTGVWSSHASVLTPNANYLGGGEDGNVYEPVVMYEANAQILSGTVWKMWYSSGWLNPKLNYAESADGVSWTRYGSNPLLGGINARRSEVVKVGSTYYLYVTSASDTQIDVYTSTNGVTWALAKSAAVPLGAAGQWDDTHVANMTVLNEGATDWKMLYEAYGTGVVTWSLGYATSTDGVNWTKSGANPVLTNSDGARGGPNVRKVGSTYYLWCHATETGATPTVMMRFRSTNWTTWTQDVQGCSLGQEATDEGYASANGQVADPYLIEVGGATYLYFSATSDGTTPVPGQHIRRASYAGTTAQLVATEENALAAQWEVQGSALPAQSSAGELLLPYGNDTDATPIRPAAGLLSVLAYTLSFTAKIKAGAALRMQAYVAYLDNNNYARVWTNGNGTTNWQQMVAGVMGGASNIGANNACNGAAHAWEFVRTGTTVTVKVDGVQVGVAQTLNAAFNTPTSIAVGAHVSQVSLASLRVLVDEPAAAIEVDFNGDGDFSDTGEVVTADTLARVVLTCERGHSLARGLLPPEAGRFSAELNNVSKDYSLENGSSPLAGLLKPGRAVRMRDVWAGTTYDIWRGFGAGFPQYADRARRSVGLPAIGTLSRLRGRNRLSSALYQNITVDAAMSVVLGLVGLDSATYRVLDTGKTTLKWWWLSDGEDLFDVLVRLYLSEGPGARLYEDGQGRIVFKNRHAGILESRSITSQATFSDTGSEPTMDARVGFVYDDPWKNIVNECTLTCKVRSAASLGVVWTYGTDPIVIGGSEAKRIIAKTTDPFTAAVTPVSGTDFTVTGGSVASVALDRTSGSSVAITVTGGAGGATITGLQLRAQSVPVAATFDVKNSLDASASIDAHGLWPYTVDVYNEIDPNVLLDFANTVVSWNKDPRPIVFFGLNSGHPTRLTHQFAREVGDMVTLVEPQTGVNGTYHLERVAHEFSHGGKFVRTTFGARKATAAAAYFKLDSSVLDGTDVLGF